MARFDLQDFKKQASFFIREKLNDARLALAHVSRIELLTEEATNGDPWGPETRTMATLADAAFELEEYERIVQVLHCRLERSGKRPWRQLYKTLVVLEYLLTHGPNSLSNEFRGDIHRIEELSLFNFTDQQGIDRGPTVRKKADRVVELLKNPDLWKEERTRAQKISFGIRGFGSNITREPLHNAAEETAHQTISEDPEGQSLLKERSKGGTYAVVGMPKEHGPQWVPSEICPSMSTQPRHNDPTSPSRKESISVSTIYCNEIIELAARLRPFKKSLSSPGHFRDTTPHLSSQPADDDIREAQTCLTDSFENKKSHLLQELHGVKEEKDTVLNQTTSSMLAGHKPTRGSSMRMASYKDSWNGFEGNDVFSLSDDRDSLLQRYGGQQHSCSFSTLPVLPPPPHPPKLRMKLQPRWQPRSLIDCDAKFGKAA